MDTLLHRRLAMCLGAGIALSCLSSHAESRFKLLSGNVPPPVSHGLAKVRHMDATNQMNLSIYLHPSDEQLSNLEAFAASVSAPESTNYHQYLTVSQFTKFFGPSTGDYQSVKDYATTNGLQVTEESPNHLRVGIRGKVGDVEKALKIHINEYKHPTENRNFFAPDAEPTVPGALQIEKIGGLHNFNRPITHARPVPKAVVPSGIVSSGGSGTSGAYCGWDFRNVYMSGCRYTGAGQKIGVLAVGGYDTTGWNAFKNATGITNAVNVNLVGGYGGAQDSSFIMEVMLDMEMAASMAPAAKGTNGATINLVVIDPNSSDLNGGFNAFATSGYNVCTCSYGIQGSGTYADGDSTAHTIFLEMASQGQTMINATGDAGAVDWVLVNGSPNTSSTYYNPLYLPGGDPYVLQVGGTTLNTTGSGSMSAPGGSLAYSSESVWMYSTTVGTEEGSMGGYSMTYGIPAYQTTNNINYSANGGSSTQRNVPDVTMVGSNVQIWGAGGTTEAVMGTSCAAPLWAGLIASANQRSVQNTGATLGFVNPKLYAVAASARGGSTFHQNISGNNIWGGSIGYSTVNGAYDLAKGWGSETPIIIKNLVPPAGAGHLTVHAIGH